MILIGINICGTQAAAEYVTQPEYIKDLINHLNIAPVSEPPKLSMYFQILLNVQVNGGVPVHISCVTHLDRVCVTGGLARASYSIGGGISSRGGLKYFR